MRKALDVAGVGVQDMADYLGVSRQSVSKWINGRGLVDRRTTIAWALRTGVPLVWLETGEAPATGPGLREEYTARDSNPEPADKEPAPVYSFAAAHLARTLGEPGRAYKLVS